MLIAFGRISHAVGIDLNSAPHWKYLAISISNAYAGTYQYEALKYINSLVQMLQDDAPQIPDVSQFSNGLTQGGNIPSLG